MRAALAYLRIAVDPQHVSGADLAEVHRRPSRGLPQWAVKWLDRCRSVADVRQAATRIDDVKVAQKLDDLAVDLDRLASLAAQGASARDLLTAVRDDIGLGSAMTLLDSTGGASGSHLDDLEALLQVADLHPDASSLRGVAPPGVPPRAGRGRRHPQHDPPREGPGVGSRGGVRRHRRDRPAPPVRGHRGGAPDPARRHHPRPPARRSCSAIAPGAAASSASSTARHPHIEVRAAAKVAPAVEARRPAPTRTTLPAEVGLAGPRARRLRGHDQRRRRRRACASPSTTAARSSSASASGSPTRAWPSRSAARRRRWRPRPSAALRAWRLQRSRADAVPAFVVLSDKHLDGIAERHPTSMAELRACPGIGPAKLESYGEEILEVLSSIAG